MILVNIGHISYIQFTSIKAVQQMSSLIPSHIDRALEVDVRGFKSLLKSSFVFRRSDASFKEIRGATVAPMSLAQGIEDFCYFFEDSFI